MRRRVAALVAASLAFVATAAQAAPPMWTVRSGGGQVVLFGSIHLLTPGLDWRTPALDQALASAGTVWFEVPIAPGTDAAAQALAAQRSRLPKGESLIARLTPAGRERLARVAANLGAKPAGFDGYQPWFAEIALTLIELRNEGAVSSAGVESTLSRAAPAGAGRGNFETPEQQIDMLSKAKASDQLASLEETLKELDEDPLEFETLQKAWIAGDVGWIEREAIDPLRHAAPGLYARLVSDRNRRWEAEIERLLKSGQNAFIVVGVGHLVGSDGVPALLRKRGYRVEGP